MNIPFGVGIAPPHCAIISAQYRKLLKTINAYKKPLATMKKSIAALTKVAPLTGASAGVLKNMTGVASAFKPGIGNSLTNFAGSFDKTADKATVCNYLQKLQGNKDFALVMGAAGGVIGLVKFVQSASSEQLLKTVEELAMREVMMVLDPISKQLMKSITGYQRAIEKASVDKLLKLLSELETCLMTTCKTLAGGIHLDPKGNPNSFSIAGELGLTQQVLKDGTTSFIVKTESLVSNTAAAKYIDSQLDKIPKIPKAGVIPTFVPLKTTKATGDYAAREKKEASTSRLIQVDRKPKETEPPKTTPAPVVAKQVREYNYSPVFKQSEYITWYWCIDKARREGMEDLHTKYLRLMSKEQSRLRKMMEECTNDYCDMKTYSVIRKDYDLAMKLERFGPDISTRPNPIVYV